MNRVPRVAPKSQATTPDRLVEEAIAKLAKAQRQLFEARARAEEARERVCGLLRHFDVATCNPAIQHHIINTEGRSLTPEEIKRVYRPEC